ncbi:hypothetical protein Maq22A_2p41570 (plasmid) [Methylobacterium aquaticum]|uniref:Integrase catalytic domain-containing protein n=1 Tax=Methylobacterium aquaticum TaxID=270351 RepID=A0A0C6G219_9HYPH|nr:hypothetical protein Maq22A_2p41570 [Methylobacterium aquaticum]
MRDAAGFYAITVAACGAPSRRSSAPTLEWVDWYNHRRLLAPIGNVPPAEAKAGC